MCKLRGLSKIRTGLELKPVCCYTRERPGLWGEGLEPPLPPEMQAETSGPVRCLTVGKVRESIRPLAPGEQYVGNGLGRLVGERGTQLKIQTSSWTFRKYHEGRQHSFEMKQSRLFAFGPHSVECPLFPKTRQYTLSQSYPVRLPTQGAGRQSKLAGWALPTAFIQLMTSLPLVPKG